VSEPLRERLGEAAFPDLLLRPLDRVLDSSVARATRVQVEYEVRRAGVAVARLSHRAGVEDPAAVAGDVQLGPSGGDGRLEPLLGQAERERHVAVPDEEDARLRGGERGEGGEWGQHVLPDRVARARVIEGEIVLHRLCLGLQRLEEAACPVLEDVGGPACDRGRVHGEVFEVQSSKHPEVVVSYQANVGVLLDEPAAPVRPWAVTDEIAEAPDFVRFVVANRLEDSFQRMKVSVDVREDGNAHGSRATLAKWAAVAIAALVWLVSGALLWRTEVPHLALANLDPREYFGAAELARIEDFRRVGRMLFLGSLGVEGLVLAVLAWKASWLADSVGDLARGRLRTGVALGGLAAVAVWFAVLPLGAVSHWWRRRYDLSHQSYAGWLRDQALSLVVMVVLVSIAVAMLMALAIWLGRWWWLAGGPALALAGTALILAYPLVVQPLFNRFEPLPDRKLAGQIEALARKEGVTVKTVEVSDASRQTTAPNAYVAGIGPTRRVVLFDTLLDGRFTRAEILSVAAHELAHVGRRHLWKGLGWFALIVIPCTFVVAWATERRGGLQEPAAVPLGLAVAFVLFLLTLPLSNAVSRRFEAEADWIALRTTNDPAAFIGVEQSFVRSGLTDPDPPSLYSFWIGTHPSPMQRIAMAKAYESHPELGATYRSREGS
jgi:Zn-dependent protease with chaperone function